MMMLCLHFSLLHHVGYLILSVAITLPQMQYKENNKKKNPIKITNLLANVLLFCGGLGILSCLGFFRNEDLQGFGEAFFFAHFAVRL